MAFLLECWQPEPTARPRVPLAIEKKDCIHDKKLLGLSLLLQVSFKALEIGNFKVFAKVTNLTFWGKKLTLKTGAGIKVRRW